jgi:hypothetical protein
MQKKAKISDKFDIAMSGILTCRQENTLRPVVFHTRFRNSAEYSEYSRERSIASSFLQKTLAQAFSCPLNLTPQQTQTKWLRRRDAS